MAEKSVILTSKRSIAFLLIGIIALSVVAYVLWEQTCPIPVGVTREPAAGRFDFGPVKELNVHNQANMDGRGSMYLVWHMRYAGIWPLKHATDISEPTLLSKTSDTRISLTPQDNEMTNDGYKAYLVLQAYPGDAHYLDIRSILSLRNFVDIQTNVDLNADGYPEVLFLLDITQTFLEQVKNKWDTPYAIPIFLNVQETALRLSAPQLVDVPLVGKSSGRGIVTFDLSFITPHQLDTFVIGRIYVTGNNTEENDYVRVTSLRLVDYMSGNGEGSRIFSAGSVMSPPSYTVLLFDPSAAEPRIYANWKFAYSGLMYTFIPGAIPQLALGILFEYDFPSGGLANELTLNIVLVGAENNGGTIWTISQTVTIAQVT